MRGNPCVQRKGILEWNIYLISRLKFLKRNFKFVTLTHHKIFKSIGNEKEKLLRTMCLGNKAKIIKEFP